MFSSQCAFQSNGVWVTNDGKRVQLRDVFLPTLTEVERVVLEKQAQEKILQLGITLTPQGKLLKYLQSLKMIQSTNLNFRSTKFSKASKTKGAIT